MSRAADKLTIFTLCLVVIALLWRKAKETQLASQEETDLEQRMIDRAKDNREWLGEQNHVNRLKNRS